MKLKTIPELKKIIPGCTYVKAIIAGMTLEEKTFIAYGMQRIKNTDAENQIITQLRSDKSNKILFEAGKEGHNKKFIPYMEFPAIWFYSGKERKDGCQAMIASNGLPPKLINSELDRSSITSPRRILEKALPSPIFLHESEIGDPEVKCDYPIYRPPRISAIIIEKTAAMHSIEPAGDSGYRISFFDNELSPGKGYLLTTIKQDTNHPERFQAIPDEIRIPWTIASDICYSFFCSLSIKSNKDTIASAVMIKNKGMGIERFVINKY